MRLLIVYHSRSGTHRRLAALAERSARRGGAEVRVRRVVPLPDEDTGGDVPCVHPDDLRWSEAAILGCPTHFGSPTGTFKRFLDSTSPLWRADQLRGLVVGAMASSNSDHGGRDATLLSIHRAAFHWGAVVVPSLRQPAICGPFGVSISLSSNPADEALAGAVDGLVASVSYVADRLHTAHQRHRPTVAVIADPAEPDLVGLADPVADVLGGLAADVVRMSPYSARDARRLIGVDAVVVGAVVRASLPDTGTVGMLQEWSGNGVAGLLTGMPAAGFVVTPDSEDGAETGVLGLYTALMHSGAVIVPAGRSDQLLPHGAGNPYGTSMTAGAGPSGRLAARREAAAHMRELVRVARRLRHSVRQVNMGENILVDHETQHP